jgi:basic amino acid/polyamine antiporter, APA family
MPSEGGVFARASTGLVREVSARNASIAGASNGPLGEYVVFSIPFALGLFAATSSGTIFWAAVIAAVFSIPILLNYSALTAAMPRSGGDYVFLSRLVSPAFGFTSNFTLAFCQIIGVGAFAALSVKTILSPALTILGSVLGSSTLEHWGTRVTERGWLIALSVLLLVVVAVLLCTGTQRALRVNTVFWGVGMVSMILLLLILLFTSHASFVASYNHFVGHANAYQKTIADARGAGFVERNSLLMLWPLVAVAMSVFGWYFWMTYFGAEIKKARSWGREVRMMFFPLLLNAFFVLAITAVMLKTFGYEFLSSVSYLSLVDPSKLVGAVAAGPPVFFTALAAGSDFIAALFIITFTAWAFPLIVCFMIMPVRCAFAWSLDQVFPARLTEVSPRFHTPVLLTCIVAVLAAVVAVIATYTDKIFQIFAVQIMVTAIFSQGVTGLAAIAFPRKMPELYRQQPISRHSVAGVPLITVTGVLAIVFTLAWSAAYFRFRTEFGLTTWMMLAFIGTVVLGAIVFYVMRGIKHRAGLPIELAFREIPPE